MRGTMCFLGALALLGATSNARAEGGAVISPDSLAPTERTALESAVAAARQQQPAAFAAVAAVDTYKPAGIKRSRHGRPSAAPALRRLGPPALLPMLELAALRADRGELTDLQWRVLGEGLLEAIGFLRDPRAAPVLEAAFLQARTAGLAERAAQGLGMLCRPEDQALLLTHAAQPGGRRRAAAVAGLGRCRVRASAERLAAVLDESPDPGLAAQAARALGHVASSWAIEADRSVKPTDADAIRRTATKALVLALRTQRGAVAEDIRRAILMVEHPSAFEWLARIAPDVPEDVRAEIRALQGRLTRSLERAAKR